MNKKQIFTLFTLVIFALSLLAPALSYDVTDEELIAGDPDLAITKTTWQTKVKEFLDFQAFTVIDGAACSTEPDFSKDYSSSVGGQLCKSNSQYTGIAFQLFEIKSDGRYDLIGEKQIPYLSKGCFTTEPNVKYHMSFYYCDSKTERSCTDTDDKNFLSKGSVTYTVDGSTNKYTDKCVNNFEVQEYYCSDNSVSSRTYTCAACSDGRCTEEIVGPQQDEQITTVERKLSVNLYDVSSDSSALVNEQYVVKGKISVNGICKECVVETGTDYLGQAFAVSSLGSGACGDDNTVGVKFATENKVVDFYLVDKSSNSGNFRVPVSVYDRCGGTLLDREYFTIQITPLPSTPSGSTTSDEEVADPVTSTVVCNSCILDTVVTAEYEGSVCPEGTSAEQVNCGALPNYNNNDGDDPIVPDIGSAGPQTPIVVNPNEELSSEPVLNATSITLIFFGILAIVFIFLIFSGGKNVKKK